MVFGEGANDLYCSSFISVVLVEHRLGDRCETVAVAFDDENYDYGFFDNVVAAMAAAAAAAAVVMFVDKA